MDLVLGMKDTHPREVRKKRDIEMKLRSLFSSWGFEEVETPSLEYFATLQKVIGDELKERLFQFINREGKLVCLRPDFTTSIARKYSSDVIDENQTNRLFYDGKIFRYPSSPLRIESELTQMGLENIGNNDPAVDAEVIALAIIALQEAGIRDYAVDIGHVGFFRGILDSLGYSTERQQQLKTIMKMKDFISLENFFTEFPVQNPNLTTLLLDFPFLRGKRDFLTACQDRYPKIRQYFDLFQRLEKIWGILADYGLEKNIWINLGLIRDFDYYSGVIFEGFSPFSGSPLLAGGRYDGLFGIFGKDRPACGFALFIERLVEAFERSQVESNSSLPTYFLRFRSEHRKQVFQLAQQLRHQKFSVVTQELGDASFTIQLSDGRQEHTWTDSDWNIISQEVQKVITHG